MSRRTSSRGAPGVLLSVLSLTSIPACGSDSNGAQSGNTGGHFSDAGDGPTGGTPGAGGGGAGGAASLLDGGAGASGADASSAGGAPSTGGAPPSGGSGGASFVTGPIRPTRYVIDDPPHVTGPCSAGGGGTVATSTFLAGQTHLVPFDWPFATVSANRPLTLGVRATGSGAAPQGSVTARLNGEERVLCLEGPENLADEGPDLGERLYRTSVPSAWVKAGLELEVTFGAASALFAPDVRAENGLTLYLLNAALFGDGAPDTTPPSVLREYLARLPFSYLDVGTDPFGTWRPGHLLISARDDGRTPTGETAAHGPIIVDENPHCSSDDRAAGTCTLHSGFGTMSGVLGMLDAFRAANGVEGTSSWYATLSHDLGGGLAGGQRGTGDDTGLTMNHELGHAYGFPHWGADHTAYPYEGVQRDRGGFGDGWALDQVTGQLIAPTCEGVERQSPMQRATTCVPDGATYDPHSDYEGARLLRMLLGAAEEITGTVPYSGGTLGGGSRAFTLPYEGGRPRMVFDPERPGFHLERYDEASNAYVREEPTGWGRIEHAEVPVVMFSGAVIVGGASYFDDPVSYVGNVLSGLDPSLPDDYRTIYDQRSSAFYWATDLSFRFTREDGTSFHRLTSREAVLRVDGDHTRFAINLPADVAANVVRLEIVARPLGHYSEDSRLGPDVTAASFYDGARVLATWER